MYELCLEQVSLIWEQQRFIHGQYYIRQISFVTSWQLTSRIKMHHSAEHPQTLWNSGSIDKRYLYNKITILSNLDCKIVVRGYGLLHLEYTKE